MLLLCIISCTKKGGIRRSPPYLNQNGRPCRSELARDGLRDNAFIQQTRVIVDVHRERARSYRGSGPFTPDQACA
ncbi:hypothetical protein PMHK_32060 [Pseudomonas sp. MHK4]